MQIISTIGPMQAQALKLRRQGKTIAFVPTMGFLHEGHLSLVRIARQQADAVVVSIFVNPAQFGPGEDYTRYPRDPERDRMYCEKENVDILFCPSVEQMYPDGYSVTVNEEKMSRGLEGEFRPGHFRGVMSVVTKLFNLVRPDVAVFGRKDAQQLRLIQQLIRDLNFPIQLVAAPIVREPDGLAMSSRNVNLSPAERPQAACLKRALDAAERSFQEGERQSDGIRAAILEVIARAPLAKTDYVAIVDPITFEPVQRIEGPTWVVLAVRFGSVRLLDNTRLADEN